MAQLTTVQDYLDSARTLLQDTVNSPYRYSNADLVNALNLGILEIRRLRPDLMRAYLRTSLPSYSTSSLSTTVALDVMYRTALLYYICGQAQLRDDETNQDARAAVFLNKFVSQLLTIAA
jgi:hypothetical protein